MAKQKRPANENSLTLTAELIRVVQETLQPQSLSVWIKPEEVKRR